MKPTTKKSFLSAVILTAAFSSVLLLGPMLGGSGSRVGLVFNAVVIGLAIVLSALVWATGSADSDDHHRKH
jgi:hypothetical protein